MSITGLFLFDGGYHHYHPLALQLRHLLRPAVLFELDCETQEKLFTLLGIDDAAAFEEHGGFHFLSVLQELLSMLELELEIVVIGIGAETDLLYHDFSGVVLHLLSLLALLVEIFLIVQNLAYRRIGLV